MSVKNESMDIKSTERKQEAPELEYKAASQDSLSMFFAAIGGAVLGMLATLLILALINGGTLNFIHPERLAVLEQNLTRVNENVGAVSTNVDNVAQQVTAMRSDITGAMPAIIRFMLMSISSSSDGSGTSKTSRITTAATGAAKCEWRLALERKRSVVGFIFAHRVLSCGER